MILYRDHMSVLAQAPVPCRSELPTGWLGDDEEIEDAWWVLDPALPSGRCWKIVDTDLRQFRAEYRTATGEQVGEWEYDCP